MKRILLIGFIVIMLFGCSGGGGSGGTPASAPADDNQPIIEDPVTEEAYRYDVTRWGK